MNQFALSSPPMVGSPAPAPMGPMIPPPQGMPVGMNQMVPHMNVPMKPPVNSLRGKAAHKLRTHPSKAKPKAKKGK